jgi:integrase
VTSDKAALQPRSVGAALAATEQSMQAEPASRRITKTQDNALEKAIVTEAKTPPNMTVENESTPPKSADVGPGGQGSADPPALLGRDEAFAIIKKARLLIASEKEARRASKHTKASDQTLEDYAKKCARLDAEMALLQYPWGHPIEVVMSRHAPKKQTFNAMRSALKRRVFAQIERGLKAQDELQRNGNLTQPWQQLVRELQHFLYDAAVIEGLDRIQLLDASGAKAVRSTSKRHQLPGLREGWQDAFLALNEHSPTYRAAGVLLRHCGLRPTELEKGVVVSADATIVNVRILGGKVRAGVAGQPWRQFALAKESLPLWFVQSLDESGPVTVVAEPDGLRAHLARLSVKLFPRKRRASKHDVILSAYLFRHSLVTEMREEGWDVCDIAAVIGESTADTVSWYGLRRRGGSVKPKKVAIVAGSIQTAVPVRPLDLSGLAQQVNGTASRSKAARK